MPNNSPVTTTVGKLSSFDAASGQPSLDFLKYIQLNTSAAFWQALTSQCEFVQEIDITADATGGVKFTLPYGAQITSMRVLAQATSGSGTVLLTNNDSSPVTIFTAVTCAVDGAITSASAGAVAANTASMQELGKGFKLTTNGSGDRGRVFIYYYL